MPLTDPGTRSPGRLVIEYQVGAVRHLSSAWLLHGVDIDASIDDIKGVAISFATALMDNCADIAFCDGWHITDPDGVQLYAAAFDDLIIGDAVYTTAVAAESIQLTATGKGVSPAIGVKSGVTRTSVFTGILDYVSMMQKDHVITSGSLMEDLVNFLNDSLFVGADKYGQKATYANRYLIQSNAYWQRNLGI